MSRINFDISHLTFQGEEPSSGKLYAIIDPNLKHHQAIFNVLSDFLQPDSKMTVQSAVDQTLQYFHKPGARGPHPICGSIVEFARQTPYDHPAQFKLVEYVHLYAQRHSQDHPKHGHAQFWESLSSHIGDDFQDPGGLAEDDEDPASFVNTTAFSAILLQSDHGEESFEVRSLWVLGVAQWFIRSTEKCYRYAEHGDRALARVEQAQARMTKSRNPFKKHHRLPRKPDLTTEKWRRWAQAFEAMAKESSLSSQSKAEALKAAALMTTHDRLCRSNDKLAEEARVKIH